MTGIEAISNAVPAFRAGGVAQCPRHPDNHGLPAHHDVRGVLVVARLDGVTTRAGQTVLSQLARLGFGSGPAYILIQAATAAVLLLAANTSYNDFPRVLFLMARDWQAPRSFLRRSGETTCRSR